jgi:hypothetical protein
MKTARIGFVFLALCLLALPVMAIAQEGDGTLDPNIQNYFANLVGMAALTTLVVGVIKKLLKLTGFLAQAISWVTAIALCYGGWLLKLGLFADITAAYVPLIYGVAIGLVSNGIFNIEFVKAILRLFRLEPPKAK